MKVLFIGNSHTFVHYVPARVARFCASHGKPVETAMLTHPGVGWTGTWSSPKPIITSSMAGMTRGASAQRPSLSRAGLPAPGGGAYGRFGAEPDENLPLYDLERKKTTPRARRPWGMPMRSWAGASGPQCAR